MAADLFEQHRKILAAAEAFLAALRASPRLDTAQMNGMRVKLSGLIREHTHNEEALILMPMRRDTSTGARTDIQPVIQELTREKLKYSEHIRQWTPQAIAADWSGYVAAVSGRVQALRRVIRLEEEQLYPVILGHRANKAGAGNAR